MKTTYCEFKVQKIRLCEAPPVQDCTTPEQVLDLWNKGPATATWFDENKECIVIFKMNTKLRCTGFFPIALGSINEYVTQIAEILKPAIVHNCHSFIISHNHPSGDPLPSQADIDMTRRLNEASRIVGVRLQDHVIIGKPRHANDKGYCSFREMGLI